MDRRGGGCHSWPVDRFPHFIPQDATENRGASVFQAPCPPEHPPPHLQGPGPDDTDESTRPWDGRGRRAGKVTLHVVAQNRLGRHLPSRAPRLESGPGLGVEPDAQHHLLGHPSRPLSTCGVNMAAADVLAVRISRQRSGRLLWRPANSTAYPTLQVGRGKDPPNGSIVGRRRLFSYETSGAQKLRGGLRRPAVNEGAVRPRRAQVDESSIRRGRA